VANPTWPISLPVPLLDGVSYASQQNVIRTQMDAGVAKTRRRFTAVPEDVTFSLSLSRAQVQTLQDFIAITLKDVLPFDWREFRKPDTEPLVTYRFKSRPKFTPMGRGDHWRADIELELLTTFQGTFLLDVAPLTT
jgi:hypothetical protein